MISRIVLPLTTTVLRLPALARRALGKDTVALGLVTGKSKMTSLHLSLQAVIVIAPIMLHTKMNARNIPYYSINDHKR